MVKEELRVVIAEVRHGNLEGRCYVARSKAAVRHQGKTVRYQTRRWFNEKTKDLSPIEAENVLTDGNGQPIYGEVLHVVISLRKEERVPFNDLEELAEAMRAATIEAMREMAEQVKARELVWVARAQPDYPNPCVKILIRRSIGPGRKGELKSLPRRLRGHWAKQVQAGEPRMVVSGLCDNAFIRAFDAAVVMRNQHESVMA